jgi:hypothetical protein
LSAAPEFPSAPRAYGGSAAPLFIYHDRYIYHAHRIYNGTEILEVHHDLIMTLLHTKDRFE